MFLTELYFIMSSNDSLKMIAFLLILVLTGCYRTNKVEGSYVRYNDHLLENLEYIPFVLSNIKRNNDMEKSWYIGILMLYVKNV